MSKIKNKTLIKVGDMVYHPNMGVYQVTELVPLSNKIIYVVVEQGKDKCECAAENSAKMRTLKPLDTYVNTPYYIDKFECGREQKRINDRDEWQSLGYHVQAIVNRIRK